MDTKKEEVVVDEEGLLSGTGDVGSTIVLDGTEGTQPQEKNTDKEK